MSGYDRWKTRSDRDDWAAQNHEPPAEGDEGPEEFSVAQFFADGSYEYVRRGVTGLEAARAARHYTHNVAAELGIVERVIITDGDNYCCFEWKKGQGVTYPPEMTGRQ